MIKILVYNGKSMESSFQRAGPKSKFLNPETIYAEEELNRLSAEGWHIVSSSTIENIWDKTYVQLTVILEKFEEKKMEPLSNNDTIIPHANTVSVSFDNERKTTHFSTRPIGLLICPACDRRQSSDRNNCIQCGIEFIFDDKVKDNVPSVIECDGKKEAHFSKTPCGIFTCPVCRKKQSILSDSCYFCGTAFIYEEM